MKILQLTCRLALAFSFFAGLIACGGSDDGGAEQASVGSAETQVFIKAEPAVDAVLTRRPRTLRVYFTDTPDVPTSSLKLFGDQGEISLSRFHSMGADDLMIEIDDHPLPNGKYRVEWMAMLGEAKEHHMGSYEFTVAVGE